MGPVPALLLGCAEPPREVGAGDLLQAFDEDSQPVRLRIDSVEPDPLDPRAEIRLYTVSRRDPDGAWQPYCAPDPWGRRSAVVLSGSWGASDRFVPSDRVTIGCASGAIGKCVRMGYAPWRQIDGVSLADLHAACVHMVRADYCGDGQSHTVDGTWIDAWDRLGVQVRDPGERAATFEAGWSPEGATFLAEPRWSDDLGAIEAECPDRLGGRTARELGALTPDEVAARFPETLLFVEHARDPAERKGRPDEPSRPRR